MAKKDKNQKKNKRFIILLITLIVLGGGYGIYKYMYSRTHESTEDAQLKCDITSIIPRVSGYIKEVRITDNQVVKKGDTLLILDDNDYRIRLDQEQAGIQIAESNILFAEAGGTIAESNISVSQTQVKSAGANLETAKVNLWRTTNDFERYSSLYNDHTITKQQYEQALAAKQSAEAQLKALQAQQDAAKQQTTVVKNQSNSTQRQIDIAKANLLKAKTQLKAAQLNLSYTVIVAPIDGIVSRVNLQPGQFIMPGQTIMNIVSSKIWVVANFKETQLDDMMPGQEAIIDIDAFPSHQFKGKVTSISPGTGSEFALLPPDNASGNFVKVVQRVPVKIEFDETEKEQIKLLRAGLNVVVEVNTKK